MSIFEGPVKELPNISVDRFDNENLNSSCFFLSHCHTDHMVGLNENFARFLERNPDFRIFCSPISALILLNLNIGLKKCHIEELTGTSVIEVPQTTKVPVSYEVTITCISAGHCPGSVMFLFETLQESILYTGDFRIAKGDIEKFKLLRNEHCVKEIDKLYFDATFLSETYWDFPSRKESVNEIICLCRNWLDKNPKNIVNIETSAKYGSEYLFIKLWKKFNSKVHVHESIFNQFWNMPDIGQVLMKNAAETRIHACIYKKCLALLQYDRDLVLNIKSAAAWYHWRKGKSKPPISFYKNSHSAKVCYATHCSCSELIYFLNYVKPKELHACTTVMDLSEDKKEAFIKKIKDEWNDQIENEIEPDQIKVDKTDIWEKTPIKLKIPFSDTENQSSSILDSPPVRKQRLTFNESI